VNNVGATSRAGHVAARLSLALALLVFQECLLPGSAFAASGNAIKANRNGLPLKAINTLVVAYARSIGCNEYVDPTLVVEIPTSFGIPSDLPGKAWLAAYSVDVGCSGGSAMSKTAFAVVRGEEPSHLYIEPELSRPQATLGFPNDITSLTVRKGKIAFTAKDFDFTKDALCCPSVVVSGKVVLRTKNRPDEAELPPEGFWLPDPAPTK
jgi:hypothetical protein